VKDHILEFTKQGTNIFKKRGLLVVELDEHRVEIPFADIHGVLIISENIAISSSVLSELVKLGVCVQILNEKYMPNGILTPFVGHHLLRARLLLLSDNQFWTFF